MAKKKEDNPGRQPPSQVETVSPGDTVDVHLRITEGDKERIQTYRGTVIAIRGSGPSRTITVRRVTRGIGIERIFPLDAPVIAGVDVIRHGRARRAKLYYLRGRAGREAVLKERRLEESSRRKPMES